MRPLLMTRRFLITYQRVLICTCYAYQESLNGATPSSRLSTKIRHTQSTLTLNKSEPTLNHLALQLSMVHPRGASPLLQELASSLLSGSWRMKRSCSRTSLGIVIRYAQWLRLQDWNRRCVENFMMTGLMDYIDKDTLKPRAALDTLLDSTRNGKLVSKS